MSIGPSGIINSAAGLPLSQSSGAEKERASQETSAQSRATDKSLKAEEVAGIGQTEEDQGADERDADGRRLWEDTSGSKKSESTLIDDATGQPLRQSRDATGQSGNQIDLSG